MESLKILIVDDEDGIRSALRRVLSKYTVDFPFMDDEIGYEIIEAASGEDAINIIDNQKPDIALLDNKLPGIDGIEVLKYISDKKYDILVMMITSYASLELAVEATKLGAYDFISKPFTPQEVRNSMEKVTKHLYLIRMTRKMSETGKQIRFQFLSMLSHELKTPINAVEGYLRMMQDKEFGNEIQSYETIIERTIQRVKGMRHLIMDLLDLTRIESSSERKRELKTINITEIARQSIDTLKPYAIQRDIKIELNVDENAKLDADPKEIEIIFNNLISNAIKYNKRQGKVFIDVNNTKEAIEIQVEDTGIGMKQEDISKLFREFVRIKDPKTKNINGSGLGLSILKRLTDLYNGKVDVKSEYDKGTVFTVKLPHPA